MPTFSKMDFSGSTNGRMIKITQNATAGDLIHTAVANETDWDEIWLWAVNSSTSEVKLTIEFGGVASPDDNIEVAIPPEDGLYLVLPGLLLQNSLVLRAFAATANVIMVGGYVNRIEA